MCSEYRKRKAGNAQRTAGSVIKEFRDSLTNMPAERVSATMGRRIKSGRPRSDLGEGGKMGAGWNSHSAAAPWPEGAKLAEVHGKSCYRAQNINPSAWEARGDQRELT